MDSEIDIVAVDAKSKNHILGECKFRNSEIDASDLERLKEKPTVVKREAAITYALFSKSGFTKGLSEQAKAEKNVLLYSLSDIVG